MQIAYQERRKQCLLVDVQGEIVESIPNILPLLFGCLISWDSVLLGSPGLWSHGFSLSDAGFTGM